MRAIIRTGVFQSYMCTRERTCIHIHPSVVCLFVWYIYMGPPRAKLAEGSVNFGV